MQCFKCGSPDALPFHKSAPYLAAKLYLCPSCIRPPKKHPPDLTLACGCARNEERYVMLDPTVKMGSTLVARPRDPSCPACGDYGVGGKIRDKHRYIKPKSSVGECTPGGGRQGYTYHTEEEQFASKDGWTVVGKRQLRAEQEWEEINILATGIPKRPRGRPKTTTPNLESTKTYMVNVANELAAETTWIYELEGRERELAMDMITIMLFARAKSANARLLAEWLPFGKSTIYKLRKKGQEMFEQLDRIESRLKDMEEASDERWIELFRRVFNLSEEDMEVTEEEFGL